MKSFFKILKDEKGRQCEGMILVAIIGIILAIAIPNIIRYWDQHSWWSLLSIPVAVVVVLMGIFVFSLLIRGVTWVSGRRRGGRREIRFWELPTFKEIKRLRIPRHSVAALSFSPNGQLLATASQPGSVQIWNISSIGD
jgi:WD40 repeat protein